MLRILMNKLHVIFGIHFLVKNLISIAFSKSIRNIFSYLTLNKVKIVLTTYNNNKNKIKTHIHY